MKSKNEQIYDILDLQGRWNVMQNMSCKPSFSKVKENHIFDEDKSVKWNGENRILD